MIKELQRLHAIRPRGAKAGDYIVYDGADGRLRKAVVVGIQQWQVRGAPHAVGLVWASQCPECDAPWFQCTETRVERLAECCPKCDVIGFTPPALDTKAAQHLLEQAGAYSPSAIVRRRGRVERHILDTIDTLGDAESIRADALVDLAMETLEHPGEGKRDTRRQVLVRAIQTLAKEKDAKISLQGDVVIFCK